jgi:hypothetical protein
LGAYTISSDVITSVEQVTSAWLTDALTESGALENGAVKAFDVDAGETRLSANARLKLTYTPGSQGALPAKLFLKMVNTEAADGSFGASEINYYFRDYLGVQGVPFIRCYGAAYSEAQRRYHLLMDDVSDTHVPSIERPLSLEHGLALAEALATLHAHWWGRPRLAAGGSPIPSAEAILRYVSISQPGAGHILASCADQLQPHWLEAIRQLYEQHPRLMIERTRDENGFTLVHGDLNAFNVLIPLEGHRPIYLIDRQPFDWNLTTWLGVNDFAFALVIDCEPDVRRQLEQPILRHYHEQLLKRGVIGYSWERLWEDYRLSMAMCIYVLTEWSRDALNVDAMPIWMPMLHRTMTAFDDLQCGKLWSTD